METGLHRSLPPTRTCAGPWLASMGPDTCATALCPPGPAPLPGPRALRETRAAARTLCTMQQCNNAKTTQ